MLSAKLFINLHWRRGGGMGELVLQVREDETRKSTSVIQVEAAGPRCLGKMRDAKGRCDA